MTSITIYHNVRCSNSRGALALIREAGFEPTIVDYLATPPDAATLRALAQAAGVPLRGLLREKEPLCAELALADPVADDAALSAAMAAHPELINRPIVVTPKGTALCRPPEKVLALLPA